jgi:hypothetical protein
MTAVTRKRLLIGLIVAAVYAALWWQTGTYHVVGCDMTNCPVA